jgi:TolB-like protein/DNA-binding winged helix-turn-helix (wHTH) protein/Tfp pilus assembly protein PilF
MESPNTLLRARFGDFVVDFESFELRKYGTRLKLQHQPFLVLRLLLQHPGQVVTREQLCTELWAGTTFVDFDAGLNAAIRRLREVLCDSADQPRYIETLPRHGYRFISPVEVLAEKQAVSLPAMPAAAQVAHEEMTTEDPTSDLGIRAELILKPPRNRWIRSAVPACVLIATVGFGAFTLRSKVLARRPASPSVYSIAVLPLQNLSGDASQDYFADGMTDALITNLAQNNSLRVISSTSSMHYRGTRQRVSDIGHELNVELVLEGSVMRSGNHVRVSAQLVDASKDQHLWARQYDRELQDVLQLQSELASAVEQEITGKLAGSREGPPARIAGKVNPQAYEAYLKGEYFLDRWSENGFDKSKAYFQQAIDLDPSYADAYAGLAEYYGIIAFTASTPPREAWLKSEELLLRSLAMDNRSVKAHTYLGMLKLYFRCDPEGAKKELDYALQLNPGEMRALDYHSYYLLQLGHTEEAIAEKQRVLEHNPLSIITNAELGLYLLLAKRTDEAIVRLQKTLELDPNYPAAYMRLGWAYKDKKQYEQAALEMQKAIALDKQPIRLVHLGEVYALWGKTEEALQTIAELREMSKQHYVAPTMIALVYARLGDKRAALQWLKKAKPDDEPKISDAAFANLRLEPQFKALEARLKPNSSCPAL